MAGDAIHVENYIKRKKLIIDHIEAIHIEGGSHNCIQCGNTYKTRISLKNHSCSKNDEQKLPMMTHTDNVENVIRKKTILNTTLPQSI